MMDLSSQPEPARERLRADTRARLVAAGIRAFAASGFHGVTVAGVARAAGVANGTFYLHFEDKPALFREIVREGARELGARLDAANRAGATAAESDRLELEAAFDFAEEQTELMRAVVARDAGSDALRRELLQLLTEQRVEELRKAIDRGDLVPELSPVVAALAQTGMAATVLDWWIDHKSEVTREEAIRTLLLLRRGTHVS